MEQDAALKDIATSTLRRQLAHNKSFDSIYVKVGGSVIVYKPVGRKSAPKRRGLPGMLDIYGAGVTATLPRHTFQVARNCVRKRADPSDVGDVNWNPDSESNVGMKVWCSLLAGRGHGGILCGSWGKRVARWSLSHAIWAP